MEAGASAVGFVLAPSKRQISLERASELARYCGTAETVAVLVNPSPHEVEAALAVCRWAQLHGQESPELCQRYRQRVWKALPGSRFQSACEYPAAAYLLDGATPGGGAPFDWELLQGWTRPGPLWLAGGLDPENVARAIEQVRPDGVDVSSGVEKSPGRKDPGLVRAFCLTALSGWSRGRPPEPSPTRPPGASP